MGVGRGAALVLLSSRSLQLVTAVTALFQLPVFRFLHVVSYVAEFLFGVTAPTQQFNSPVPTSEVRHSQRRKEASWQNKRKRSNLKSTIITSANPLLPFWGRSAEV